MRRIEREVLRAAGKAVRGTGYRVDAGERGKHYSLLIVDPANEEVVGTVHYSCTPGGDVGCEANYVRQAVRRELRRIAA